MGLVGGEWRHAAKFGSAFARLFILLYEQKNEKHTKKHPFIIITESSNKKILFTELNLGVVIGK